MRGAMRRLRELNEHALRIREQKSQEQTQKTEDNAA
jgi:hypothetical protein